MRPRAQRGDRLLAQPADAAHRDAETRRRAAPRRRGTRASRSRRSPGSRRRSAGRRARLGRSPPSPLASMNSPPTASGRRPSITCWLSPRSASVSSSREAAFSAPAQRRRRSGRSSAVRTTGTTWSGPIMCLSSRSVTMSGRESCGLEENATATSARPSSSAWIPASATFNFTREPEGRGGRRGGTRARSSGCSGSRWGRRAAHSACAEAQNTASNAAATKATRNMGATLARWSSDPQTVAVLRSASRGPPAPVPPDATERASAGRRRRRRRCSGPVRGGRPLVSPAG